MIVAKNIPVTVEVRDTYPLVQVWVKCLQPAFVEGVRELMHRNAGTAVPIVIVTKQVFLCT